MPHRPDISDSQDIAELNVEIQQSDVHRDEDLQVEGGEGEGGQGGAQPEQDQAQEQD